MTGYGLDGPGIESRWGRDFSHLSRPALGPTQPPVQWVPGLSPGVKSGRGVTLTPHPPSSAVGHERVELYLYSPYGPYGLYRASVPVQGCTLPYIFRNLTFLFVGRDSVAGIATRYGMSSLGVESRGEVRFSAPVQTGTGTGSFPWVKLPGRWINHPLLSNADVKESVEL